MSNHYQQQINFVRNLYKNIDGDHKRVSVNRKSGSSQDLSPKQMQTHVGSLRHNQLPSTELTKSPQSPKDINLRNCQVPTRDNTNQDNHVVVESHTKLSFHCKIQISEENQFQTEKNIQRNLNIDEGQIQIKIDNQNHQLVCHKNYNQIIKSDQKDSMKKQAPDKYHHELHVGNCQQQCKDCHDYIQDRIENQGSTEKSDNLSGGKQSGISSTKAQNIKGGLVTQNVKENVQANQFSWKGKNNQQQNNSLLNKLTPQQPTSQQPHVSNQRRGDRNTAPGQSNNKGSQDSRGTPSVAPSFTHSVTPSCGPSSTNALLSDIIRLDDDEEIWLKGQLMGTTTQGGPMPGQIINHMLPAPQMMPIPITGPIGGSILQDINNDQTPYTPPAFNQIESTNEKKNKMTIPNEDEEEDVLKLEISNRQNDDESSCSMHIDSLQKSNQKSHNTFQMNINKQDMDQSPQPTLKKSICAQVEDDHDDKDDSASQKDSSPKINQTDFPDYQRLYQMQMERAQQQKIAQYRREAEEAAKAKLNETYENQQKESFYTASQPFQIQTFDLDEQERQKTQEIQKEKPLIQNGDGTSDVEMQNESKPIPNSQTSKFDQISLDDNMNDNDSEDDDLNEDDEEDEYDEEEDIESLQDKIMQVDQEVKIKRATRTRRFKDIKDRTEGPPVKTMVLNNDELPLLGTKSKSKQMRQSNTQKYISDSETMFDGILTQHQPNTQKNDRQSETIDIMQEEFIKRMEKEDLCYDSKKWEHWTKEQDLKLFKLVDIFSIEQIPKIHNCLNDYITDQKQQIPPHLHDKLCKLKTEMDCIDRWLFIRSSADDGAIKQIKGNWTTEEDLILKQKVEEYGLKKWKEIATFLPGRIGKQCRERWYNNVDPNLNKEKWTVAEDIQLMELHKQYGNKWVQIQKFMPGRIDNDIKNRFNASLRKYKTFDEYLESIDKKRAKHQKKMYWRQHYELRSANNSKRLSIGKDCQEFNKGLDFHKLAARDERDRSHEKGSSEKKDENESRKVSRTRLRDEKCQRKLEEKIKRRRSSIRKLSNAEDEKSYDKDQSSYSEISEEKNLQNLDRDIQVGPPEDLIANQNHHQFTLSDNHVMESSEHESQIVSAPKAKFKNEGNKQLQEKPHFNFDQTKMFSTNDEICEIIPQNESIDMDDEERILVNNLLLFDLPKNLTSDKLLYRKIFRITRFSADEYNRKCRMKSSNSAFEIYTHIPPENTGPKVLYITAKSQDGKDKDSDVIKDIEGHAIEKIQTSKLSEKALQEKWRMEEEELEKVRQAREILRLAKNEGASETELIMKAKMLLRHMICSSEFSAKLIIVQSDKSDQTVKSFHNIGTQQIQEKLQITDSSTIGIHNSQQRNSLQNNQFQSKSNIRSSKIVVQQKSSIDDKTMNVLDSGRSFCSHPHGDPQNLTGNRQTYQKIFTTQNFTRSQKEIDAVTNLLLSISKNGSVPSVLRNCDAYNLRNHNSFYAGSSQNGISSLRNQSSKTQKIVQINKCGNSANISIIHPGGEKTTCLEKSSTLRGKAAPSIERRSGPPNNSFQRKQPEVTRSNCSQQGRMSKSKPSYDKSSPKRASPLERKSTVLKTQDIKTKDNVNSRRNPGLSQNLIDSNCRQQHRGRIQDKSQIKPIGGNTSVSKGGPQSGNNSKTKSITPAQQSSVKKSSASKQTTASQQQVRSNPQRNKSLDDSKQERSSRQEKIKTNLNAQANECKEQIDLAASGVNNPGQRNSIRIMARKLDQINKQIEEQNQTKSKLRPKRVLADRKIQSESEDEEEDDENSSLEQDEEGEEEEQEDEEGEQSKEEEKLETSSRGSQTSKKEEPENLPKNEQKLPQKIEGKSQTLKEKLKRFELLKKIQDQLNQIKHIRTINDNKKTASNIEQRLNSSIVSQKQPKGDQKGVTTRSSIRLRQRDTNNKIVLQNGKNVTNKAGLLKEKDIRNCKKSFEKAQKVHEEAQQIAQENRYNFFLAKELKIDPPVRNILQKQINGYNFSIISKDQDQKMNDELDEKECQKKEIEKAEQSQDQNQSKSEYTHVQNFNGQYPPFYNQFEGGSSMYTVMQQPPLPVFAQHQSQVGSPGFHHLIPGQNYGQQQPYMASYGGGHYSQMQQIQQAQIINDHFNRHQPYPQNPNITGLNYSSFQETPSRKIELQQVPAKIAEPHQREDKPVAEKKDPKDIEHNHYNRMMMMAMLQQKMGANNQNQVASAATTSNSALAPSGPHVPQPTTMSAYPQGSNSYYPYQFSQNQQAQFVAGIPSGQGINHHQIGNLMSSNLTNMTNLLGTSNNSMNINSMRMQELNSCNPSSSPPKPNGIAQHSKPPCDTQENNDKTLTQNSQNEENELSKKK